MEADLESILTKLNHKKYKNLQMINKVIQYNQKNIEFDPVEMPNVVETMELCMMWGILSAKSFLENAIQKDMESRGMLYEKDIEEISKEEEKEDEIQNCYYSDFGGEG